MSEEIKEVLEYLQKIETDGWNNIADDQAKLLTQEETKILVKHIIDLQRNYDRLYNENCKLRENHKIDNISLLDENEKLQQENQQLKEQKKQAIECIHLFGIYKDTPDKGLDIRKILKNILEILGDKE